MPRVATYEIPPGFPNVSALCPPHSCGTCSTYSEKLGLGEGGGEGQERRRGEETVQSLGWSPGAPVWQLGTPAGDRWTSMHPGLPTVLSLQPWRLNPPGL